MSKFAHLAANKKANGAAFLREVVEAVPYQIHTVLTDNGPPPLKWSGLRYGLLAFGGWTTSKGEDHDEAG